mmetsp:Transcript_10907/g.16477  ORF Transcript_10907/g.16477 Transcript_10907/m.16477 type:complete len:519 (-) Transcript_10907:165-1721(-)
MSSGNRTFKAGIDLANASRRREEMNLTLRNKKKEEMLDKKRRGIKAPQEETLPNFSDQVPARVPEQFVESANITVENLPQMIELVNSSESQKQGEGLVMLRKLLSTENNPPLAAVIQTGCLPRIIQFLHSGADPKLQFEAAWILTNIASGEHQFTQEVVNHNAIPVLLELFQSPSAEVREQAVWTIGNIAGDCAQFRDQCLEAETLPKLLWLLYNSESNIQIVRNIVWTISNLCRGKPSPDYSYVSQALPIAVELLSHTDEEVVADAAWAISYISDASDDRINMVINSGVIPKMIEFFAHSGYQIPAIRTVGNIVTGNDLQTQIVVDAGALANFHYLLGSPKRNVRKETLWTISNIAAGTPDQVAAVVNSGLMPLVIAQLSATEFEVRKEATWVVSNIALCGQDEQAAQLLNFEVIPPLCDILCSHDSKSIMIALEALENLLKIGRHEIEMANSMSGGGGFVQEDSNAVVKSIIECGGLAKIDELQSHRSDEIYHLAARIIDEYFSFDEGNVRGCRGR